MSTTDNTDGYPAPEARVRAYLEAQAEEDVRTMTHSDEIAWAVPDHGTLTALAIGDIRDVLAELDAARRIAEAVDVVGGVDAARSGLEFLAQVARKRDALHAAVISRPTYLDATDPHATAAQVHPSEIRDVPSGDLEARYHVLDEFYSMRAPVDPRCGCSADNEGGKCYWDDLDAIAEELAHRGL